MIWVTASILYLSVAIGIAMFLFETDKGKRDATASAITGLLWPLLLIGIPIFLLLKKLDRA